MKMFLLMSLLSAALMAAPADQKSGSSDASQKNAAPKSKKGNRQSQDSLTGCVDEQDGKYVLLNHETMAPIASLEADGFPTEGFAKHVGEKVTVRGTSNSDGERPVFRVRSIEVVSQTCAPQII